MALFPDDHFKLGRYLGPSINIGLALTAMILKRMVGSIIVPHTKPGPKKNGNEQGLLLGPDLTSFLPEPFFSSFILSQLHWTMGLIAVSVLSDIMPPSVFC